MKAVKLAPSILAADFPHLGGQVAETERGGADRIHVDVMDAISCPMPSDGLETLVVRALMHHVGGSVRTLEDSESN